MRFKHPWLMVLCVIGMGSVFILPALGMPLGSLGSLLLILLCPLSHLLMMRGGHASNDKGPGSSEPLADPVINGAALSSRDEPPQVTGKGLTTQSGCRALRDGRGGEGHGEVQVAIDTGGEGLRAQTGHPHRRRPWVGSRGWPYSVYKSPQGFGFGDDAVGVEGTDRTRLLRRAPFELAVAQLSVDFDAVRPERSGKDHSSS